MRIYLDPLSFISVFFCLILSRTSRDDKQLVCEPCVSVFQVRIAELLGVAGTDVPIAQIEKLIPPYKVSSQILSFLIVFF